MNYTKRVIPNYGKTFNPNDIDTLVNNVSILTNVDEDIYVVNSNNLVKRITKVNLGNRPKGIYVIETNIFNSDNGEISRFHSENFDKVIQHSDILNAMNYTFKNNTHVIALSYFISQSDINTFKLVFIEELKLNISIHAPVSMNRIRNLNGLKTNIKIVDNVNYNKSYFVNIFGDSIEIKSVRDLSSSEGVYFQINDNDYIFRDRSEFTNIGIFNNKEDSNNFDLDKDKKHKEKIKSLKIELENAKLNVLDKTNYFKTMNLENEFDFKKRSFELQQKIEELKRERQKEEEEDKLKQEGREREWERKKKELEKEILNAKYKREREEEEFKIKMEKLKQENRREEERIHKDKIKDEEELRKAKKEIEDIKNRNANIEATIKTGTLIVTLLSLGFTLYRNKG